MTPTAKNPRERLLLVLSFAAIYVIWGSTYLAIRFAVETIPPLMVAGMRHLVAGSVMVAWAWKRGYRVTREELKASAVLAFLFFFISHGSLHWAEQTVPSGLSALLVAGEPLIVALMGLFIGHKTRFTWMSGAGLAIGFLGVALLSTDKTLMGGSITGALMIIVGTISWSIGMFYAPKARLPKDAIARSAWPMFLGSLMLLTGAAATGEMSRLTLAAFTWKATGGLLYLIVFGSIVAFTAYTWLLERTSPVFLATHTYVNPIVAVLLGWLLAGEAVDGRLLVAGAMVVASVVMVSVKTVGSRRSEVGGAEVKPVVMEETA